jgi:hypothetical protein
MGGIARSPAFRLMGIVHRRDDPATPGESSARPRGSSASERGRSVLLHRAGIRPGVHLRPLLENLRQAAMQPSSSTPCTWSTIFAQSGSTIGGRLPSCYPARRNAHFGWPHSSPRPPSLRRLSGPLERSMPPSKRTRLVGRCVEIRVAKRIHLISSKGEKENSCRSGFGAFATGCRKYRPGLPRAAAPIGSDFGTMSPAAVVSARIGHLPRRSGM